MEFSETSEGGGEVSPSVPIRWWKMDGAGNEFVVLDGREQIPTERGTLARLLCRSAAGPGADGLLVVTPAGDGGLDVDYRNADGSPARFCGNGARCAALFGREVLGRRGRRFPLHFPGALVEADLTADQIAIEMPAPRITGPPIELTPAGRPARGWLVDAGVLHVTAPEPADRPLPLEAWAEAVAREHAELARRANITLVRVSGEHELRVRTLERGVGPTAACGSGALAAAGWALETGAVRGAAVDVIPPSGQRLAVSIRGARARLVGPARFAGRGELAQDF